jgi:hypothetical protein
MRKLVLAMALVGLSAPALSQVLTYSSSTGIQNISGTVSGVTVVGNRGWQPMPKPIYCEEPEAAYDPPAFPAEGNAFAAVFAARAGWQRMVSPTYDAECASDDSD